MDRKFRRLKRLADIEVEEYIPPPVLGKRRANSASPTIEFSVKKILLNKDQILEEYQPVTQSTPYMRGDERRDVRIEQQPKSKIEVRYRKYILGFQDFDFEVEYQKMKTVMECFSTAKQLKQPPPQHISLKDEKKIIAGKLISEGGRSYVSIAKELKLRRQDVRNIALRNKKFDGILETKKLRKMKLNQEHIEFLNKIIDDPLNVGITLKEMRNRLVENFEFQNNKVSVSTIYRALKKEKKVYKKIIWKKPKDNEPRTKNLRKIIAMDLLKIFMNDFSPVYIDESSFNLNLRPCFGWGTSGKKLFSKRPAKSTNYSLLAAMDITGIIGWMLFRGGVKKEDFFSFLMELVKHNDNRRWEKERPIFFMDNASIHKSKIYMTGNFNKYYTTIYNAPYSPQLNPIENCFSQIKAHVQKSKVNTENQLITAIKDSMRNITPMDCLGYVMKVFNILPLAYNKEDFI